ncbi:hypothetical protein [Soonwooa sp.]|uniref:hypothetical protein n=1 Tax=Soonwooa sp. TaxID=1938592 RepID=UPI00261A25BA|nr:hypothetical protein [Soonwooa sp.]
MKPEIILLFILCFCISCQKSDEQNICDNILTQVIDSKSINTYNCNNEKDVGEEKTIFVNENLGNYVENDLEFIPKNYTTDKTKSQKISINQNNTNLLKLKSLADIPKVENRDQYLSSLKNYYGTFNFGNLYLDKNHENAIIPLYYSCNSHSTTSYLLYLKKVNKNWKIIHVKQLWIS